ncbi:MAG: DUF2339 domain-containing protein [Rhodobacter sp.]|uniref:DUF2339 domain-containing protein n=1 Tax=Pararhodobacter sp. TaxID=2127056 RepID=UPI001D2C0EFA|nr:DUF2339 domain-containing protein [Pararhodobacter sp.]MCB1344821.1 DUF2339 domain-containing protein [Paracoccaceae bacterium]MCC0074048.1 DUF2339 domain-containing protein [Rhodobacter sp.]HPD91850.1 DUF2339 domain-containing protein [Pararhodobacter sp.]
MADVFVIAVLLILIAVLVSVAALAMASRARRQVDALSHRVAQLERALAPETTPETTREDAAAQPAAPASTPWSGPAAQPPRSDPPAAPRPPSILTRFGRWLRTNWIYPVAGVALVMAAIYLVQYSIEKGLLSAQARIGLALALGAALIAGALWLRRRWGEGQGGAGQVPATLAGAGAVTLFAAILSAYHLYAMLGQRATLVALALTAALVLGLGWVLGPMLAALGVLGGIAAPFLLGPGEGSDLLYGYFAAIAVLGTGIDGFRRWRWVSGLAVVGPLVAGALTRLGGAGPEGLVALVGVVVLVGTALPGGALMPQVRGPMIHRAPRNGVLIVAALAIGLGAAALILLVPARLGILAAGALALALPLWTRHAPALDDQAGVAALILPAAVANAASTTPLFLALGLSLTPWLPLAALALAVGVALVHLWRSEAAQGLARRNWALASAAVPGSVAIVIEALWKPATVLGADLWALALMGLAAVYTALAVWAGRRDAGQGPRLGAYMVGAFTMIALGLMVMLGGVALTGALAVLLVAAAAMDRRLTIPELGWITGLGAMALSVRLLWSPGLDRMIGAQMGPAWEFWLVLLATLGGPVVALQVTARLPEAGARRWARVVLDTAVTGTIPIAVGLILARFLSDVVQPHAALGIEATALIAMAWVQSQRADRLGAGGMRRIRRVLAALFATLGLVTVMLGLTLMSPLQGQSWVSGPVDGWPVLNDLVIAYALPAGAMAWAVRGRRSLWAGAGRALAGLLAAVWVALAIRQLWHGGKAMALSEGFAQGELYAYTVALLLAGAGALALALRLGGQRYRLTGLGLIGLAAAKAFLVDADGLSGLLRVGAFLGLGLSLAGLAWLNAWVGARDGDRDVRDP